MKIKASKKQSGYALLMFTLVLMGTGGLLLVEFSEGIQNTVESKKYEHNRRVLKEAKYALLQFAYNYPVFSNPPIGPGRLPCADTDNDGIPNCGSTFGRFPWAQANLNFYDIRDADGERLWYAVSSSFRPQATIVNSDTSGTITLRDQSGNVIFDGANPGNLTQYGIAAVIIAPGTIIDRNGVGQDRSIANSDDPFDTTADTDPGIITATNYLDLALGEDNASFNNSTADGFILGPVNDTTNDQFIVITAAEVIEMAEKATLQAYAKAINDYLADTGGVYPWLFNYDVDTVEKISSKFEAHTNFNDEKDEEFLDCVGAIQTTEADCISNGGNWQKGNIGRIPTMFGDYFSEAAVISPRIGMDSMVSIDVTDFDVFLGAMTYTATFPGSATGNVSFVDTHLNGSGSDIYNGFSGVLSSIEPSNPVTKLRFEDLEPNEGVFETRLIGDTSQSGTSIQIDPFNGTPAQNISNEDVVYFYDGNGVSPSYHTGSWRRCESSGSHLEDCHLDAAGNPDGHGTGAHPIQVMRLTDGWATIDYDTVNPGEFEIKIDADSMIGNPVITPATGSSHATIEASFPASALGMGMATFHINYEIDYDYDGSSEVFTIDEAGILSYGSSNRTVVLTMRYYPQVPVWAYTNGWHNSMILHYAAVYKPGGTGACDPLGTTSADACLKFKVGNAADFAPANKNKIAILLNTAEHDWTDSNSDGDYNDPEDWDSVLDNGNRELDYIMRWRWPGDPDSSTPREIPPGNDNLLILGEL